jgi:hypothetical protein
MKTPPPSGVEFSLKEVDLREANGFENKIRASGARVVNKYGVR